MSKMGNTILEIQELAHMGIPNAEIAKATDTSSDIVDKIVEDMFAWDNPKLDEEILD